MKPFYMSCFIVPVGEHKKMARERDSRSRDLSHDRDRERDRSRPNMTNHTSSSDPKLLMSRVFIGKLPTDRVCRGDLEEMFSKYGKILGMLTRGQSQSLNTKLNMSSCSVLFINTCLMARRINGQPSTLTFLAPTYIFLGAK